MSASQTAPLAIAGLLVLAILVLVALVVRRSQLRRTLGTFDGSLRLGEGRWVPGVFRYAEHRLEFLRWLSLTPRPAVQLRRTSLELKGWHDATPEEKSKVPDGAIVVQLDSERGPISIGMSYEAYTGLSAWLEAGPVAGVGTWRQIP